jgi:hypothetical protein
VVYLTVKSPSFNLATQKSGCQQAGVRGCSLHMIHPRERANGTQI